MSRHEATALSGRGVEVGALVRFEDRAWQVTGLVGGRVYLAAEDGATGCVLAAHLVAADGFEVVGRAAPQIPPAAAAGAGAGDGLASAHPGGRLRAARRSRQRWRAQV
ncbi:hypothetical protein ACFW84_24010 [Streptomyces anulatus]|uniref:hypothetical protein n=1 Tax=Streptomyces anulatus TaxID=1892 RepID=UPI003680C1E4